MEVVVVVVVLVVVKYIEWLSSTSIFAVGPHNSRVPLQCCHGLDAQKKYKKLRKKVQIVPQKSTKKVRLHDLTHSNL